MDRLTDVSWSQKQTNSNYLSKKHYYCCKFLGLCYFNFYLLSCLIVYFSKETKITCYLWQAGSRTICKQSLKPTLQPDHAVAIVMWEEKADRLIFWFVLTEQLFYSVHIQHLYSFSVLLSVFDLSRHHKPLIFFSSSRSSINFLNVGRVQLEEHFWFKYVKLKTCPTYPVKLVRLFSHGILHFSHL